MLNNIRQAFKNNTTLRYGVPMVVLVVGGSFGLREFSQIRYDIQKHRSTIDPATAEIFKSKSKETKTSLESEYEKIKDNRFEDWNNIRGPRPYEDSKSLQEQQRINNSTT